MKYYFLIVTLILSYGIQAQQSHEEVWSHRVEGLEGKEKIDTLNVLIGEYACFNQQLAKAIYNVQLTELNSTDYPIGEFTANKHYGTIKYCDSDVDSAIFYFYKASRIAANNQLYSEAGRMFNNMGHLFQMKGNNDSSKFYFEGALQFAEQSQDTLLQGGVLIGLGIAEQEAGRLESSLINYQQAMKLAEEINNQRLLLTAKQNIATIHYDHFPERLRKSQFLETLQIARSIGDRRNEMGALEFLAAIESDSGNYDAAIKYYDEALEVNQSENDPNMNVLLLMGKAKALYNFDQPKLAIDEAERAIDYAKENEVFSNISKLHGDLGQYYLAISSYPQAIANSQAAIAIAQENDQMGSVVPVYQTLAKAYEGTNQFKQAYNYQKKYTELNDSLLNETKSKQLIELETKYETEKKEAEIASLSQQAAIQALELKQKNLTIVVGAIVVIVLLLIVYFIYRAQSEKRERAQSELQQRFLRSQLNPHFISNALLAIQNFILKNEPKEAASYLSKFSKLMREILENSRQEFITVEEELSMLTNFLEIHKMRLQNQFDYVIEVDDHIDPEMDTLPPMLVQPFVENAIEHGISGKTEGGKISLSLKKSGDYIQVVLTDNGKGIQETISSGDHHSLSNQIIAERINNFNRSLKHKIQLAVGNMTDEKGEISGAKIELMLPFSYV